MSQGVTGKHIPITIGVCSTPIKINSIYTEWGIWSSETVAAEVEGDADTVTWSVNPETKIRSTPGLHGEPSLAEDETCETLDLARGNIVTGKLIFASADGLSIEKIQIFTNQEETRPTFGSSD